MERYGLNRDQAIEHIKQVAEDEQAIKQLLPQELTPPASETMPSEEQDQRQAEQAKAAAEAGPDETQGSESGYEDRRIGRDGAEHDNESERLMEATYLRTITPEQDRHDRLNKLEEENKELRDRVNKLEYE